MSKNILHGKTNGHVQSVFNREDRTIETHLERLAKRRKKEKSTEDALLFRASRKLPENSSRSTD